MSRTLQGLLAGLTAASLLLGAGAARAAEPTLAFSIPHERLGRALIDFALQARLSISTGALGACRTTTPTLSGRFTVRQGLERLLAGSGCGYRFIDARSVEIVALPPPPPRPAVKPAPPQPDQTQDLAPLVIVATRAPTPIDQLAYGVSAVTRDELRGQGVADAGGLAQLTPAMTVTNLGQGRDKILLRGLSDGPLTGRTQSMVGVYLDDVRITSNAPDPDLRLTDIEQVEVLRGPQGALYGSGSLGGVVHLVSAAPDLSDLSGWVSAGVGATRGGEGSSTLEGMVNLPLLDGRAALRLVAWREVQGGYIDDAGLNLKNVNRSVRQGGRASLALDLAPGWTVTASLVGQAINADDTQYALAGLGPYLRSNTLREPHDSDFNAKSLSLRGDLGWSRLRWSTALVRHDLTSRYDATPAPPLPMPAGLAAFDDDNSISSLITEASLTSRGDATITWLGGLYLARTRQSVDLTLSNLAPSPVVGFTESRLDRLDEAALFGEVILPLTSRLDLTLGGRLFSSRTRVESWIEAPLLATSSTFKGQVSQSGFAPKVVLSYRAGENALVYLQAAEGYRAGGLNTTGAPDQLFSAPGGPEPYRAYQGDELLSLELGGNVTLLDGRLRLRAAMFEVWWSNIQSDQLLASGLPFTANIGDGRNLGLEAEAAWRSGGLTLRGELLANSPELDRANPAFPARSDLSLAGVPEVSGGVSAGYVWDLGAAGRLEFNGRYAWVGRSTLTFDAATSPRMGGYGTARLAATLTERRWQLGLAVDNPSNERGDTFAYGNPFTLRTERQITPSRPATVSLTLKVFY